MVDGLKNWDTTGDYRNYELRKLRITGDGINKSEKLRIKKSSMHIRRWLVVWHFEWESSNFEIPVKRITTRF